MALGDLTPNFLWSFSNFLLDPEFQENGLGGAIVIGVKRGSKRYNIQMTFFIIALKFLTG